MFRKCKNPLKIISLSTWTHLPSQERYIYSFHTVIPFHRFVSSRNRSFAKIYDVNSWQLDRDQSDDALDRESRVSRVGLRGREWRGVSSIIETSVFRASDYSNQTTHSEHVFALPPTPIPLSLIPLPPPAPP